MIESDSLEAAAAVRAAVETLLYDIQDTIEDVGQRLMAHATDGVSDIERRVASPLASIIDAATWPGPFDEGADQDEWAPVYRLIDSVSADIAEQEYTVAKVADRAIQHTSDVVASFLPSASEVFSGVVKVFADLIDGLLGGLSNNSEFWTSAATIVGNEIEQHHDKVTNTVVAILNAAFKVINDRSADPGDVAGRMQQYLNRDHVNAGGTVEDYIAILQNQPTFITNLANVATAIATVFEWLSARNTAFISGVRQSSLYQNPTTPLSVSQLVDLLRMKLIGEEFAHDHAKRSGLSNELFDLLRRGDERLLDTQPILELWRRSGDDSVLDELYRLGYSQESVAALRTLALAVATPSDVVRFLVRDVFDPDAVQRGQLDQDFDVKYNEDVFRAAGVSRELARYYWAAHWQLPSPTQGYEMLHRVDGFTIDDLRALLKAADYAPGYVDKLIAISYLTPGRIDVRRMYETGVIQEADLETYYKYMGYSPEHAAVLKSFTIRLKEIADEGKADRRFGRIATEIVRSFVVGTLSEVQARDALTGLGFTEERANLRIAEAEYARQRERADTIRDAIGRRYVRGYSTEEQAREDLAGYAFDEAEIQYLIDGWSLQRQLREETDEERHQKDLSKSEIIAAYRDGLMGRDDATSALEASGYDARESGVLLALADAAEARADAKVVEASARTLFLNRRRTGEETRAILEGVGLQPERIAALLTRWQVEQEERRPDISTGQLERMLMQGVIPMDQIEERLRQRGYTESDISALLTLYGTDMSIAEEKLKAQQSQFEQREARLARQGDRRLDLTERGQNLGQERFNTAQQGLQQRFEQGIESRAALQTERLEAQRTLQSERIAAAVERDAQAMAASRERQATQLEAQMQRLQLQLDAAQKRADDANAARQSALEQRERLANEARASADARQRAQLEAQADRQQRSIDAADRRAQEANQLRQGLQDQREAFSVELTTIRDELQRLRDIRQEAARARQLGRQEQVQIRKEQRASARRDITASETAATQASLQAIQLQKSAAVAEVEARFAALQAQISQDRQQQAMQRRLEAERALAAATPVTTLLDSI